MENETPQTPTPPSDPNPSSQSGEEQVKDKVQDIVSQFPADEVKDFYKHSLPTILKKVISNPIEGTYDIFKNSQNPIMLGVFLIITVAVAMALFGFLSTLRGLGGPQWGLLFKGLFFPAFFMGFIILSSALVKVIANKAEVNLKNEILVGGLVGLPFAAFTAIMFVYSLFVSGGMFASPAMIMNQGLILVLVLAYVLIFANNIFQQALRASNVSDRAAFYFSPVAVLLSLYLGFRLWTALFVSSPY